METSDLIRMLAADVRRPAASLRLVWTSAVVLAIVLTAFAFLLVLGPRPDIAAAAQTPRFIMKFLVTFAVAASAFFVARAMLRPEGNWRRAHLALAPALVALAVIAELFVTPQAGWVDRLIGANALVCLLSIPSMGIAPLAVLLLAMRHGAPSRPGIAGATTGVLAGGIAAIFYAAHCNDDSPLFIAVWYTLAIAILALAGAAAGYRFTRW